MCQKGYENGMNMEDFFKELEACLKGEVTDYEYADSLAYYRDYFREQKSAGRSEEEIIKSLGSPRLIARSIIDAHGLTEEKDAAGYYDAGQGSYEKGNRPEEKENSNTTLRKIGFALGLIAVLFVFGFLVKALMPVILVIIVLVLLGKIIRGE